MEDDSPGTPLGRLKAISVYAERLGHSPLSAKPAEVFLIEEIERLRRQRDNLLSYINGISRQTAEMVRANSDK